MKIALSVGLLYLFESFRSPCWPHVTTSEKLKKARRQRALVAWSVVIALLMLFRLGDNILAALCWFWIFFGPWVWYEINSEVKNLVKELREKYLKAEEERARNLLKEEQERQHQAFLDADSYAHAVSFKIGRHANEMLALRYGIANLNNKVENSEIWVRKLRPAGMIEQSGKERVEKNVYLVELQGYRNRQALAVIEKGTDYIKTFLPRRSDWFDKHQELELVIKGNPTFTIKEIARFHVEKTVGR